MPETALFSIDSAPFSHAGASRAARRNPAVSRCWRAYRRAYNHEMNESGNRLEALDQATDAYLRLMPDLFGAENIRDFIACTAFAVVHEIVISDRANHFLDVARVALSTLRQQTRTAA